MPVPDDFPRRPDPAAIAGVHPKIPVRFVNGKYFGEFTPDELESRHDVCADLVNQLVSYFNRKMSEQPTRTREQLLDAIEESAGRKGWDITQQELKWCMTKLRMAVMCDGTGS